ncbi:MAG: hypothetical protein CYG61_07050, partial [Actinobacteria bacterium]
MSGNRVQAVYAVASDRTDRFESVAPLIRTWAAATDGAFARSAAETGGERHVRWVTNPDCTLSLLHVRLSPTGDDSVDNTDAELAAQGLDRRDRKYLVWTDANVYCGIAGLYDDDRAGPTNANNGTAPALFGRIDTGCWGRSRSVEAHELMHTLGGVQSSAPHATPAGGHCTDEYDLMCYADDLTVQLTYVCPSEHEANFDCGHDDYFHTNPPAGSYLASHWNTASSSFLTTASQSTAVPPDTTPPGTPTGLRATAGNREVHLSWNRGSESDLAGYRVRRGNAVVASVAVPSASFVDTGLVNGVTYTYTISSFDRAGNESAASSPVSAVPNAP